MKMNREQVLFLLDFVAVDSFVTRSPIDHVPWLLGQGEITLA